MNKLSNPIVEYPIGMFVERPTRWIVVTPTICQGDVPAYWEDSEPVTYATEREAWKEIADTQIMKLQAFIEDGDDNEVPDFTPEDYVVACDVLPDGAITTSDHGVLFDPRTDLSRYGR